jgi:UDP-N-acetylglucosamine:LPS N-acetylglucosamine transferase
MKKKLSICIPSSCGGHLKEVLMHKEAYSNHNVSFILNDKINNQEFLNQNRVYFISHIENYFFLLINFFEAYKILKRVKPDLVISTGASPAFIISLISKFLYKSKIIYIESITRIKNPSKTGKLMYLIADLFLYRHPGLSRFFPKGNLFEI